MLGEIERLRRHLWWTAMVALAAASGAVLAMSFWSDFLPEGIREFVALPGFRSAFVFVGVGFVAYAVRRERDLTRLTHVLIVERERSGALQAALLEQRVRAHRVAELEAARADTIASVTHELKTPLTSLMGYLHILRHKGDVITPEQRDTFIDVMQRQGDKLIRMIEELLQSTRVEADLSRLQRVRVDLTAIARTVAADLGTARERSVAVDAPAGDLGLYGDPAALEHVVANLVDNALKYSPDDSTVRVVITDDEGGVVLQVRDEGRGIPSEEVPFIFERFQQSSQSRGRGSVGLGLYIVHGLVRAHNGTVTVESEVDKGTTFTIVLPRRR
jgi:signal transduction histidine kinase